MFTYEPSNLEFEKKKKGRGKGETYKMASKRWTCKNQLICSKVHFKTIVKTIVYTNNIWNYTKFFRTSKFILPRYNANKVHTLLVSLILNWKTAYLILQGCKCEKTIQYRGYKQIFCCFLLFGRSKVTFIIIIIRILSQNETKMKLPVNLLESLKSETFLPSTQKVFTQ